MIAENHWPYTCNLLLVDVTCMLKFGTIFPVLISLPYTYTARNHFSDQRFLIAAVPKGLLLMQWYQPYHAFKRIMVNHLRVPVAVCICMGSSHYTNLIMTDVSC